MKIKLTMGEKQIVRQLPNKCCLKAHQLHFLPHHKTPTPDHRAEFLKENTEYLIRQVKEVV